MVVNSIGGLCVVSARDQTISGTDASKTPRWGDRPNTKGKEGLNVSKNNTRLSTMNPAIRMMMISKTIIRLNEENETESRHLIPYYD
jgi:hypothetical protein